MKGVEAQYIAAPFHVLATNNGPHPALKWAELTARLIVEPRSDATVEARAQISNLRTKIEKELVAIFHEVNAGSSPMEVIMVTSQGSKRIIDLAAGTPWSEDFAAAPIQSAIEDLILRNLSSAHEIALMTE
jgi:hypothetical protein